MSLREKMCPRVWRNRTPGHVGNQYALQNKDAVGLVVLKKMIHYEAMEVSDHQVEPIWIPRAWFASLI